MGAGPDPAAGRAPLEFFPAVVAGEALRGGGIQLITAQSSIWPTTPTQGGVHPSIVCDLPDMISTA